MRIEFDANKLKELVLYVAYKSLDDPSFGATKLNKILFFSDFLAYGQLGKPITGATYQKLDQGPAPRELLPIQERLEEKGEVILLERKYFGYVQKRLWPCREPDISTFSPQEISLVDEVIEALRDHNAFQASVLSHRVPGWQLAGDRDEIPYEAVFLSREPLTESAIRRGQQLAEQYGWRTEV